MNLSRTTVVPVLDLNEFLLKHVAGRFRGRVLAKVDIEMSEAYVMPHIFAGGGACAVDEFLVEVRHENDTSESFDVICVMCYVNIKSSTHLTIHLAVAWYGKRQKRSHSIGAYVDTVATGNRAVP